MLGTRAGYRVERRTQSVNVALVAVSSESSRACRTSPASATERSSGTTSKALASDIRGQDGGPLRSCETRTRHAIIVESHDRPKKMRQGTCNPHWLLQHHRNGAPEERACGQASDG